MRSYSLFPESAPQKQTDTASILKGLNEAQRTAAEALDGPLIIIAGAGSGKTRTLTYRIAYLMGTGKARPSEILALTFTNKAAREMKERIVQLVGEATASGLWMGTFHSMFSRILRREADRIGFSRDFTIYDSEDSERTLRNLMLQHGIDTKQISPRAIQYRISGAKNRLISPASYAQLVSGLVDETAARFYPMYQDALRRSNAMDFDDLLIKPIELFQSHPDVLNAYQHRWKYISIDEYQDTNHAQYVLAKMLAAGHKNICVVGDDAQSIYAFRGADISNILNFRQDYPEAATVRLEQNYRSTQTILDLADSVIRHNKDQLKKKLWTENDQGDHVTLFEALSERDEAQKIEQAIRHLHLNYGLPFRAFAILYRTNAQSRSLEDALRRAGLPYRIVGGVNFYQRREIKDALAYLRLLVNPSDAESLRRVINTPTRGIGAKTVERLAEFARNTQISLWQAVERVEETNLGPRAQNALGGFRSLIKSHADKIGSLPADELARKMVHSSGLLQQLREENTVESLARWENVQELLNAVSEFVSNEEENPSLSRFLQEVSLLTDLDSESEDPNHITLMTLHASKALEFPVIFLSGLEENLFPLATAAQDRKDLEEERRLLYVGVTRAKNKLFLSYARSRFRYGENQPGTRSRFLEEMDPSLIRLEGGRKFNSQPDRFQLRGGNQRGYDNVDPNYWKKPAPSGSSHGNRPKSAESSERQLIYDEGEGGPIVPGMQVMHATFGQGKVISVEGRGDMAKATVFFKEVGQKKLVMKFARLQRIG